MSFRQSQSILGLSIWFLHPATSRVSQFATRSKPQKQRLRSRKPLRRSRFLTVCEVLHDVGRYDGKSVVIVGRSVGTMEGSWLDEECAPQMFVNGRFWKPNISTAYAVSWFAPPPPKPRGFKWDRRAIQAKLEAVQRTTGLRVYEDKSSDHWLAVFGRLEARLPHQFPLGDGRTGLADGFGHLNGSPAQLISPRDGFLQLKSE